MAVQWARKAHENARQRAGQEDSRAHSPRDVLEGWRTAQITGTRAGVPS